MKDLLRQLLPILERMIEATEHSDRESALKLNDEFSRIYDSYAFADGNIRTMSNLEREYDNCRQSCLACFSFPRMREKFLDDAKKRFYGINH